MAVADLGSVVEGCKRELEWLLRSQQGKPLPRNWINASYLEEEIALLEDEVLPAMELFLKKVAEVDSRLEAAYELECLQRQEAEEWPMAA
jgi:hypothetical protein